MSSFLFSIFIMFLIIIYLLQAAEIYSLLSAVCVFNLWKKMYQIYGDEV